MPSKRQTIGEHGEIIAQSYLVEHGYHILDTNWHCTYGEIDIIAQKDDVIAFVEVKTRRGSQVQQALAAITPSKRDKLIASAYMYVNERDLEIDWRIDAIGIALPRNSPPIIEHVEDALGW